MKLTLSSTEYSSERLISSALGILEAVKLCSIATTGLDHKSHINTAYFCYTDDLDLYFVSDPATTHGHNIALNPSIAIAVFDTNQPWGEPLRGLQIFGKCHLAAVAESAKALATHAARFHAYGEYIKALNPLQRANSPHRFYVFKAETVKILDEAAFGEEVFVTASVVKG